MLVVEGAWLSFQDFLSSFPHGTFLGILDKAFIKLTDDESEGLRKLRDWSHGCGLLALVSGKVLPSDGCSVRPA